MDSTKIKNFRLSLTLYLLILVFISLNCYPEMTDSDWEKLYNSILECIKTNAWEEACVRLTYLKAVINTNRAYDRFHNLEELETEVHTLVNKNLEILYQKGLNLLREGKINQAAKIFKKIVFYDPGYRSAKEFLQLTGGGRKKEKTVIVTSETPDKIKTGLRIYKPEKCYNGYTLFTHMALKESSLIKYIYLIDMHGNIIHRWTVEDNPIFAQMKPDGNIVYNNGDEIRELDLLSRLVWRYPGCIDHAFEVIDNRKVIIERGENLDENPRCTGEDGLPAWHSCIEIIDSKENKILWDWHSKNHIEDLEKLLGVKIFPIGDWANSNSCEVIQNSPLGEKDKRFQNGNILFSFCTLGIIGIIDRQTKRIVWTWGHGELQSQHTPSMLKNGNILIFDNGSERGWSRVIEVNPLTEEIVWEYHAEPKESFFSKVWGNAQRLPNGNTLICESESNRIFEITPQGEIVWDFISAYGKEAGCHGIYRAYRYSPEFLKTFFKRKSELEKQF